MRDLQRLVDQADEAALLAAIDGLCATRDWDELVDLARRCRDAVELGKQLWGVAMHIDYRLALEAPAEYAGRVLRPGASRFTLGPLTEVAAGRFAWDELSPHVADPPSRQAVAQERVLRGEDLRAHATDLHPELPLVLASFEPDYAQPVYRDRSADFPQTPVAVRRTPAPQPVPSGVLLDDDQVTLALSEVVEAWVTQSSGQVRAVAVSGDATRAVGQLSEAAALLEIEVRDALAMLQWAGASGGAHGRRPGGAAGRFSAWWAAAACAEVDWPDGPEDLEDFTEELANALPRLVWYRWRPALPERGWVLRLAVSAPDEGRAWAVEALDEREDEI